MKKTILAKIFSIVCAVVLVAGTLYSNQSSALTEHDHEPPCPEGDTYKCWTSTGGITFYKGTNTPVVQP